MNKNTSALLGRSLLRVLNEESAYVWDKDGRSNLFRKESADYVPTGSLLKVYYYPHPMVAATTETMGQSPILREARSIHSALWTQEGPYECFKLPFDTRHQKMAPTIAAAITTTTKKPIPIPGAAAVTAKTSKATTESAKSGGTTPSVPSLTPPQSFYGLLMSVHRNSVNSTFTLRNVVEGVGVEMTFPLYSPLLIALEIKLKGVQKRSKWYWLRDKPLKRSTFS